jgi:hypothetical protein
MSICTFAAVSNINMCLRDSHALDLVLHQIDMPIGLTASVTVHWGSPASLDMHSGVPSFHDGQIIYFQGSPAHW